MEYAVVIISIGHRNIDHIFHYGIPNRLRGLVKKGMRVIVPFGKGNRLIEGYVTDITDSIDIDAELIKEVSDICEDHPVISAKRIALAEWMKEKYYTTFSSCFRCIVPKRVNEKSFACIQLNSAYENISEAVDKVLKKDTKQKRVLEVLLNGDEIPVSHIKTLLDVDDGPINALIKKNVLVKKYVQEYRGNFNSALVDKTLPPKLTKEQEIAVAKICDTIDGNNKKPVLIHGVTGSGKTEVYIRAIEKVLSQGKEAIVLVPEISLTQQTVERFVSRFGSRVAVTHSRLSDGERYDQWTRALRKEISVMIGPRSAVFTPFEEPGIIIIDEEHEATYKSDQQSPKYDAREIAEKLSELYGCTVVLGSATPSVASYYKTQTGEYDLIEMNNRVNNTLPVIHITDMRREIAIKNFSVFGTELREAMAQNLQRNEQTILFLNRRGYSTFVSCRKCGYVMSCDNCNVNYTYHKGINRLSCHYCGKSISVPEVCPQCGSKYIKYFGAGTEKIEQEVLRLFPKARVLRMDMDTTKRKNSHQTILEDFRRGKADILIGTQMIAKGLDFPNVTLVGVVAADLSLNIGDYRSAENTYQLVSQVAGRAGRADKEGTVYIQTYSPDHYSIQYAARNNYKGFYNEEITFRQNMNYPPFTNIFLVMMTGENEYHIRRTLGCLADIMKRYNKNNMFTRLGPTPAVISKINNIYRWQIIVKCENEDKIRNYVLFCLDKLSKQISLDNINVGLYLNPSYIF